VKAVFFEGELSFFTPTSLEATLSSSSTVIGNKRSTLSVTLKPDIELAAVGFVTLTVPEYYDGAGSDFMIDKNNLDCGAQSGISVTGCSFDTGTRTVRWAYKFDSGIGSSLPKTFTLVRCFHNPISPEPLPSFYVASFDSNSNAIGESGSVTLSGVTQANTFRYVAFDFDAGTSVVYRDNALQLNIGINHPLVDRCFFKFVFPPEIGVDERLFEAEGNSFFT
jgi:hypothetical protein